MKIRFCQYLCPALCFLLAGLAQAQDITLGGLAGQDNGQALVDEARCYSCHQLQDSSLGPPWQAIAARHSQNKEVMVDVLATKIVHGGGGNWGLVPMVPNQRVTQEEARVMAAWILEQTPE